MNNVLYITFTDSHEEVRMQYPLTLADLPQFVSQTKELFDTMVEDDVLHDPSGATAMFFYSDGTCVFADHWESKEKYEKMLDFRTLVTVNSNYGNCSKTPDA